ncbi:MAG: carboxylating nicotinate-nucleotide diphosphorylase [bacterium]
MNKKQKIQKYFNQKSQLTLRNKKYLGQAKFLTDFFLKEDCASRGDITTDLVIKTNKKITAKIIAKQAGIIAGIEEAVWFLKKNKINVVIKVKDGNFTKKAQIILALHGNIKEILKTERTVLNILQRMSGIASQTKMIAQKAGKKVLICATRKTQWGLLDKKAVILGGGGTHRLGLYDFVLIKENHLKHGALTKKTAGKLKNDFWEVEVENEKQALDMAKLNPSAIMFDDFKPKDIKKAIGEIRKINKSIIFEASGQINEKNINKYVGTGVDVISLGALTHSARAMDISLEI